MSATVDRTRVVTWEDPRPVVEAGLADGGLATWRRIASGDLPRPPISALIGFDEIPVVEEGRIVFRLSDPDESLLNPLGTVHGGVLATMLDSAMGCAVHTTLPGGVGYTTLEIKVNYVRPAFPASGPLLASGEVVHRGGKIATAEGRITVQDTGKLIAHATTTCMLLSP